MLVPLIRDLGSSMILKTFDKTGHHYTHLN